MVVVGMSKNEYVIIGYLKGTILNLYKEMYDCSKLNMKHVPVPMQIPPRLLENLSSDDGEMGILLYALDPE